jgi:hypothetical protein
MLYCLGRFANVMIAPTGRNPDTVGNEVLFCWGDGDLILKFGLVFQDKSDKAGVVLISQRMTILTIFSVALSPAYRFELHDKLKISLTRKYSVASGASSLDQGYQRAECLDAREEEEGVLLCASSVPWVH